MLPRDIFKKHNGIHDFSLNVLLVPVLWRRWTPDKVKSRGWRRKAGGRPGVGRFW